MSSMINDPQPTDPQSLRVRTAADRDPSLDLRRWHETSLGPIRVDDVQCRGCRRYGQPRGFVRDLCSTCDAEVVERNRPYVILAAIRDALIEGA